MNYCPFPVGVIHLSIHPSGKVLLIEWRIKNFISFTHHTYYDSPDFYFRGKRWNLSMSPEESSSENEMKVLDVFLERNDLGPPELVHYSFGIKGTDGVEKKIEEVHEFDNDSLTKACGDFCPIDELKSFSSRLMPNNVLTIMCEMKIEEPNTSKDENSSTRKRKFMQSLSEREEDTARKMQGLENFQKSLRSVLTSGEDSDLVIKVRGKEFAAHKVLLRSRSPVFKVMFSHDMVEKQSGTVSIDDCDPRVFSDFLDHVYTGSLEMISMENVFDLYAISDKYEMDTLKKECVEFMKRNLSVASFCDVMKLSVKYAEEALVEFSSQFFCKNSSDIVTTAEWQSYYEENSADGYKLLIKALTK